ncbi:MAG TPA: hypothetical protein VLW26_05880 [Steroidobacteraceae bacterium]|nr:hypothetical protein [Steroidobacteraceae bacterium]
MSARDELRAYLRHIQRRGWLTTGIRGGAIVAGVALAVTLALSLLLNRYAFSLGSLWSARAILCVALGTVAVLALAYPLWRLTGTWVARHAERQNPLFGQRLLTFAERDASESHPFIELLAADTLAVARAKETRPAAATALLGALFVVGIGSLATLVWLIRSGPGALGYGAALLWTGNVSGPLYEIRVMPGDATVKRHADQLISALPVGLDSAEATLFARYHSTSKWERVAMQRQAQGSGFQFLLAGVPEDLEYYVQAGAVQSHLYQLRVADIPSVKRIEVTYHHPGWMHLPDLRGDGGDLRAYAGTEAQLRVVTDGALERGRLILDDGREVALQSSGANTYRGSVPITRDGTYHVAALDRSQLARISEDYFIEAAEVKAPDVALVRPAGDYRASPIEEVTIGARAEDPFGVGELSLHYSVNGGAERSIALVKGARAVQANGAATLSLEDFKLVPGDVVSVYALARDARTEARSDMAFIQVDPFQREFSQSQQSGGGGGGGGNNPADIPQREKEIIAATWKEAGLTTQAERQAAEQAKFLSDVQTTLRGQTLSLAGRLEMRDLTQQNEQFSTFQSEMAAAAQAMQPAAQALQRQRWSEAVPEEEKALQHLLRAQSTFRQIQVAFGSRGAGGGSGAVNSEGRDLASLFDLELDTQRNQYETGQTATPAQQRARDVDEALRKLDELARRQEDLASGRDQAGQSAQQRWQQEMLRRNAEEIQRELERLARGDPNAPNADSSAAASGNDREAVRQALGRVREAQEAMRRAVDQQSGADAERAAERLRGAKNLLGGVREEQANGTLASLAREADRLGKQSREQTERLTQMLTGRTRERSAATPGDSPERLLKDRQQLADDLTRLQQNMRAAERTTLAASRQAASKLREALNDLDEGNAETKLQRSADLMRRGFNPAGEPSEREIAAALDHLSAQLREAQNALAGGNPDNQGALADVERVRGRLSERLGGIERGGGGRGGPVDGGWNAGNNGPYGGQRATPQRAPAGADPEESLRQNLNDLERVKRAVANDPAAQKAVDELVRSMQRLDPKRFPGNPQMVDELYASVLADVDKLELQLGRDHADHQADVRMSEPQAVPEGYQAAVADYFRRLSKNP